MATTNTTTDAPQQQKLDVQPTQQPQPQPTTAKNVPAEVAKQTTAIAFPKQLDGLQQCFSLPKKAFLAAGGTEQQFAREVNFAMQAMLNNPYLIQCAKAYPEHLVEAIKNVSLTGLTLNPELRLGYLVPYNGKVKFQASYMGKSDILIRTGVVKKIEVTLVYEKDKFAMAKGTDPYIKHEPNVFGNRGELLGGYYVAVLASGEKMFDAMPKERIDEIKSRSESVKSGKTSPWNTDYIEMVKKTVINWAFKFLPKTGISDDMVKVLEVESQLDDEIFEDWRKAQANKPDSFDEDEYVEVEDVN